MSEAGFRSSEQLGIGRAVAEMEELPEADSEGPNVAGDAERLRRDALQRHPSQRFRERAGFLNTAQMINCGQVLV